MKHGDAKDGLTRRGFFLAGAGMLAAAAVGGKAVAAQAGGASGVSPLMTTLSSYMSNAAYRKLPDAVTEKTKQMILDTLAAMISGSELPPGRFALQFARTYQGSGVATVVSSDALCGPMEAALVNGMLAHSDETDDTHPPSQSHPGCSIVPAALAVGERFAIDWIAGRSQLILSQGKADRSTPGSRPVARAAPNLRKFILAIFSEVRPGPSNAN